MGIVMLKKKVSETFSSIQINGVAVYLLQDKLLDTETLQKSILDSEQKNMLLTHYLVHHAILSSEKILDCCAKHFELPIYDLANYNLSYLQDNAVLQPELMCRYRILPLRHDEQSLYLGMTDPSNHSAISAVTFNTGLQIYPMLISESEFDKILSAYLRHKRLDNQLESALLKITPAEEPLPSSVDSKEDDGPVTEFVNQLIQDAIEQQVSDIHIEPFAKNCRIRFRRDGLLQETTVIPLHLAARIIARLKILSELNIAERRLPQDGRLQLPEFPTVDIRINTCPTLYGEKIVLRILDASSIKLDIQALGFTEPQLKVFIHALHQPQGLILVTGPTGSGKTMTLYSALNYLNQMDKNISSVEDPVEIELPGINQINVNPRIGLDFSLVLRALLRQDPDIIMVGEIRDPQTAAMAVQAAQTGHRVLSTLHTNSAIETLARLQSLKVDTYQLIQSVSLIIAQRLIRKLCGYCKQKMCGTTVFEEISMPSFQAAGCKHCHQGYQGRTGVFELLPMTDILRELILKQLPVKKILETLRQNNMMLLQESGAEKIKNGITSMNEVMRVIGHIQPCN